MFIEIIPDLCPARFRRMLFEMSIGVFLVLIPEYSIFNSPEIGLKESLAAMFNVPG